jgi:large subunit ribosomal protein L3
VVQRKTPETDGYHAAQLGFAPQKEQRLNRPQAGHFKKSGSAPCRVLREVRCANDAPEAGATVDASAFEGVAYVDVVGVTKGRGFQGVVKRYRMGGGRATHGSGKHRAPGSIGMCEWPARVLKNKRMPGQMGARRATTQNLKVIKLRTDDNVLLVRGAVAGPNGGFVVVRKAQKKAAHAS